VLFNSLPFIFLFLPVVLGVFFAVARFSRTWAAAWLAAASLFFYGWWNPNFVWLLLASIGFNYTAGCLIGRAPSQRQAKAWLAGAVVVNLLLLAGFKYSNFFIATANAAGAHLVLLDVVLPLGISFFSFTQIAFLVDVYRGKASEFNFVHYLLFVTWFPHLIAGPVLHHGQMMPQFAAPKAYRPDGDAIAVGLTMFAIGLFKKVVLADHFATYASPTFDGLSSGAAPMFFEAWVAALAYAMQLYFDFSGYCDMAIGISGLFNVKLPLNFNSPYKAVNIIDFWRRWHMTLSAFLRDYLYVPLGGNRHGTARRHANLMITMLLGGLWHGAGWNFVLWGGLHGLGLVLNHGWRSVFGDAVWRSSRAFARASTLLTFLFVVVAWVPFRATSLHDTQAMLSGMLGLNGFSLPSFLSAAWGSGPDSVVFVRRLNGVSAHIPVLWLIGGLWFVWALPNSQEWLAAHAPACEPVKSASRLAWRPTKGTAVAMGLLFAACVLTFKQNSPFLYFQF